MFWKHLQICGFPVEDPNPSWRWESLYKYKVKACSSNCKGRQIIKSTKSRAMLTWIETQTANNSSETRRNEILTETTDVWKTKSRAIGPTIWYSMFTVTSRNIIALISCPKIIMEQLVYFHVLTTRAVTSAATFLVVPGLAPLLFKIDSTATSASSILTTSKRCANR